MFSAISWQQYFTIIVIGSFVYYLIVLLKYYRKDLPSILKRLLQKNMKMTGVRIGQMPAEAQKSVLSNSVYELTADLSVLLNKATQQRYPREELVMALRVLLNNYNTIKGTKFEAIITDHIKLECQMRCNILFDAGELAQLW